MKKNMLMVQPWRPVAGRCSNGPEWAWAPWCLAACSKGLRSRCLLGLESGPGAGWQPL